MDTNPTPTPTTIRIMPILALFAFHQRRSRAWRAWILLRTMDQSNGSGIVPADSALEWAISHGISRRQWRTWVKDAIHQGFITAVKRCRDGEKSLVHKLTGVIEVARLLNCSYVGKRPVNIPLDFFLDEKCVHFVWAAYLSTLPERPISRASLREATSIPERTQLRYEEDLKIVVTANYTVTTQPQGWLDSVQEFQRGDAFVFIDPDTKAKLIAFRLPNTYQTCDDSIETLSSGSNSRINKELEKSVLAKVSWDSDQVRVYHKSNKSQKAALSKMRRLSILGRSTNLPDNLYVLRPCRKGHEANIYDVLPF